MDLEIWLPGVLTILIGISGWKFPHLINIFTKEEKEKMDLKGTGKLFRNIFVPMGVLQIGIAYFSHKDENPFLAVLASIFIILIAIFVFAAKAEKYKNKR